MSLSFTAPVANASRSLTRFDYRKAGSGSEALLAGAFRAESRVATRFVPRETKTSITVTGSRTVAARIIDLSAMSVAVEADFAQADPWSVTKVGKRAVRPGRRLAQGMVFLFEQALDSAHCGPDLVL